MAGYATQISYQAHDGLDNYCKFTTLESFINGDCAFPNRAPYTGWEDHVSSGEDFIRFIGPIYTPSAGYAENVVTLIAEADALLAAAGSDAVTPPAIAVNIGTIVIDPGHGGTSNLSGSSSNNAISLSGVKEKKLTLDFCLILRDQLLAQSAAAGEKITVVFTRTTDTKRPWN